LADRSVATLLLKCNSSSIGLAVTVARWFELVQLHRRTGYSAVDDGDDDLTLPELAMNSAYQFSVISHRVHLL